MKRLSKEEKAFVKERKYQKQYTELIRTGQRIIINSDRFVCALLREINKYSKVIRLKNKADEKDINIILCGIVSRLFVMQEILFDYVNALKAALNEMRENINSSIIFLDKILSEANMLKENLENFKEIIDKASKRNPALDVRDLLDNVIKHDDLNEQDTLDFFEEMKGELEDIALGIKTNIKTLDDFKQQK